VLHVHGAGAGGDAEPVLAPHPLPQLRRNAAARGEGEAALPHLPLAHRVVRLVGHLCKLVSRGACSRALISSRRTQLVLLLHSSLGSAGLYRHARHSHIPRMGRHYVCSEDRKECEKITLFVVVDVTFTVGYGAVAAIQRKQDKYKCKYKWGYLHTYGYPQCPPPWHGRRVQRQNIVQLACAWRVIGSMKQ